jgi:hypothetical protein
LSGATSSSETGMNKALQVNKVNALKSIVSVIGISKFLLFLYRTLKALSNTKRSKAST